VLFVEATAFPGDGKLQITGQLGDVMKESAAAALSYVKANAWRWGEEVSDDWFRTNDVHVHVPAGAVPKDGPSAGITMVTALVSLVTRRPARSDTAMTGEITLTGQVLPIGGLKEKSLAAQRAGITRVIAPRLNEADLDEFPHHLLDDIEFVFVDSVDRVLDASLEPLRDADGKAVKLPRRRRSSRTRQRQPAAAKKR
jgi:ATP-dependent Lon protease